jgi:hypothetical protein
LSGKAAVGGERKGIGVGSEVGCSGSRITHKLVGCSVGEAVGVTSGCIGSKGYGYLTCDVFIAANFWMLVWVSDVWVSERIVKSEESPLFVSPICSIFTWPGAFWWRFLIKSKGCLTPDDIGHEQESTRRKRRSAPKLPVS